MNSVLFFKIFVIMAINFNSCFAKVGHQTKTIVVGLISNFSMISKSTSNPYSNSFRNGIEMGYLDNKKKLVEKNIDIQFKEFDYGLNIIDSIIKAKEAVSSNANVVIGNNWSSQALANADIFYKGQLPMISPSATANRLSETPNYVYTTCFNNDYMAKGMVDFSLKNLKKSKKWLTVAVEDCAYCKDLANSIEKWSLVNKVENKQLSVIESKLNYEYLIKEVIKHKPDIVFLPNQEIVSAKLVSIIISTGLKPIFIGGDGWGDSGKQFLKIVKDNVDAYIFTHWSKDLNSFKSKKFIKEYLERFGRDPDDTAVLAYDSFNYLSQVLGKIDDFSRISINSAIRNEKYYEGLTGPMLRVGNTVSKDIVILTINNTTKKYEILPGKLQ